MKGRRKLESKKWSQIAQLVQGARETLKSDRCTQRAGRFISKAEGCGRDAEPIGVLAGQIRREPAQADEVEP